jgi:protein O-mannosyl-transferase
MNQFRQMHSQQSAGATAAWSQSAMSGAMQTIMAVVVLGAAIWGIYGRSLSDPFIFDDQRTIVENPSIVRLWPLIGGEGEPGPLNPPKDLPTSGRPLVNLTMALNYHFGELNPVGYRTFNICLHWLSALLLAAIVRRTLLLDYFGGRFERWAGPVALATALLWAVHPLLTEAVVYVTQRTELMVGFFYFATLYASLRYWVAESRSGRRLWLTLAVGSSLAGMACKEVMVTAPLLVLLFERTFITGSFRRAWKNSWPLYVGLVASLVLLSWLNAGGPRSISAGFHAGVAADAYWLMQAKVLLVYLKLAVWPWPLTIHYGRPYFDALGRAWPWLLAAALLGVATVVLLWRKTATGFVGAWVWLILSPTLVVPIATEIAAERRMYLPLAAIMAAIVAGIYALARGFAQLQTSSAVRSTDGRMFAVSGVMVAIGVCFAVMSVRRLAVYESGLALWQDAAMHQPDDYLIQTNLSVDLADAGRFPDAVTHAREALRLNPHYAEAHNALGLALAKQGELDEAIAEYRQALRDNNNFAEAYCNLGAAYGAQGQLPQAIENLQHAVQLNPNYFEAQTNLARALAGVGRLDEALEHLQTAVRLRPDFVDGQMNLGNLLAGLERWPEAAAQFEEALRLKPNFPEAHIALAQAYAAMNRLTDARVTAQIGLAQARANGQAELAQQIEGWLNRDGRLPDHSD